MLEIATMADFFGNRWQINAVMLPTPSNSGDAYLMPVGQVMKLFGKHIGSYALKINDIPDGIDVFASISPDKNKIYIHIVNTNYSSGVSIKLFDSEKEFISYEIKADPQEEITSLNPNCFNPVKNEFKSDSYYSHPASVSVLEFSI